MASWVPFLVAKQRRGAIVDIFYLRIFSISFPKIIIVILLLNFLDNKFNIWEEVAKWSHFLNPFESSDFLIKQVVRV